MNWVCSVCGYKYEAGSEKGAFEDLSEDWCCPICNAGKSEFTKDT